MGKSDLNIRDIDYGGKIVLLLQIIAHCDAIGDKVVVFSQSLPTLSYIEEVLNSPDWMGFKLFLPENTAKQIGGWKRNEEYLRIDGSVDAKERGDLIDTFHSAGGHQSKLFLISTNAGGLGINLTAANRVVLFDTHWNPVVDLQAIYRCYRYGQTKPTYCYRLLTEGSMEQKIYSRAATKTSLSNFVIDQQNPERSFTRRDLDLLRVEDTWVCCNACNKWRMLPNHTPAEVVENLPDEWYCKDNIYDLDRSVCAAKERQGPWMVEYFERRRAREEAGVDSQSQVSQGEEGTADMIPAFDERHHEYLVRDEVLDTLIQRAEGKKTATTSSGKMTWVSKWDFDFGKTEKLEPAQNGEAAKSPIKKSPIKKSPIKKSLIKQSPITKSPTRNSPTNKSPAKESSTKVSLINKITSPTENNAVESTQVSEQLRTLSPHKNMCSSFRSSPDSSDKIASPPSDRKLKPRRSARSSAKSSDKSKRSTQSSARKLKSPDKSPRNKRFKPLKHGSSSRKRKSLEKSATKVKAESKSPSEKKTKTKSIVDLTFSESDSD